MTRVYLVRHGETEWNESGRFQGHSDVTLSPAGLEQARRLSRKLAAVDMAGCYASDLARALETAQILAEPHGLPVQTVPGLREINFGDWEGLSYREIEQSYSDLVVRWRTDPGALSIPRGETFTRVAERSYEALVELLRQHPEGSILVVTHGGTIRTLLCRVLGLDINRIWSFRQDNTALNILDIYPRDEGWHTVLGLLNDTNHLD